MKTLDLIEFVDRELGAVEGTRQAWRALEEQWRGIVEIQGCALVRVNRIKKLAAKTVKGPAGPEKAWTVTYEVREAVVQDDINPDLVVELLREGLVGTGDVSLYFIVNPTRVEEFLLVKRLL